MNKFKPGDIIKRTFFADDHITYFILAATTREVAEPNGINCYGICIQGNFSPRPASASGAFLWNMSSSDYEFDSHATTLEKIIYGIECQKS